MENIIHDVRERWTKEEWQAYYQLLAEINEAEEEVIKNLAKTKIKNG